MPKKTKKMKKKYKLLIIIEKKNHFLLDKWGRFVVSLQYKQQIKITTKKISKMKQSHYLTREELEKIYKAIDDFQADCEFEEYRKNKVAFDTIKTMLHKRLQKDIKEEKSELEKAMKYRFNNYIEIFPKDFTIQRIREARCYFQSKYGYIRDFDNVFNEIINNLKKI